MKEKIDVLSPATIFALTSAFIGDFSFIFIFGALIPIIGLVFLAVVLTFHYACGAIAVAMFWHKTRGWLAKLTLILALIIPLPLLCIGIILAIFLSNRFVAFIAEQAIIVALTPETGGATAVAGEGAVIAMRTAEATAAAARAARAAKIAEEAAEGTTGAARGVAGAAEEAKAVAGGARGGTRAAEEALGEKPPPMEQLQRELVGEEPPGGRVKPSVKETPKKPEGERERKFREAREKVEKVKGIVQKIAPEEEEEKEEEEEREDLVV